MRPFSLFGDVHPDTVRIDKPVRYFGHSSTNNLVKRAQRRVGMIFPDSLFILCGIGPSVIKHIQGRYNNRNKHDKRSAGDKNAR